LLVIGAVIEVIAFGLRRQSVWALVFGLVLTLFHLGSDVFAKSFFTLGFVYALTLWVLLIVVTPPFLRSPRAARRAQQSATA
jgi:hypothetical protein